MSVSRCQYRGSHVVLGSGLLGAPARQTDVSISVTDVSIGVSIGVSGGVSISVSMRCQYEMSV